MDLLTPFTSVVVYCSTVAVNSLLVLHCDSYVFAYHHFLGLFCFTVIVGSWNRLDCGNIQLTWSTEVNSWLEYGDQQFY